jgi:hypothetical protein
MLVKKHQRKYDQKTLNLALSVELGNEMVAVGMRVTPHPPHRSVHEELPHTAPASGNNAKAH